eukprot:TRINITY_DN7293_c0_g1_i1.p1 TRINITY_DN7293_c0_g1~~TRINITY_DN7293_c0_g1_i1.p1  ORF type:complete len:1326 (+),score=367.05 TRINITY_DN7293_c0_g1_i1:1297-5274(+)
MWYPAQVPGMMPVVKPVMQLVATQAPAAGGWLPAAVPAYAVGRGRGRGAPAARAQSPPLAARPAQLPAAGQSTRVMPLHERRKAHLSIIKAFLADSSLDSFEFPEDLTGADREFIHRQCDHYGLFHKSHGPQHRRILRISKSRRADLLDEVSVPVEPLQLGLDADATRFLDWAMRRFAAAGVYDREIRRVPQDRKSRGSLFRVRQPTGAGRGELAVDEARRAELLQVRKTLPAFKASERIVAAVRASNVVIISGATGSGKTTQVPQFILDHCGDILGGRSIVCTQPRRISAMSVSTRVADERGQRIGGEVGYHVRFEGRSGPHTRLLFVTTGVLLRRMHSDPDLTEVGCVICDEVHERDVSCDFSLLVLRQLIRRRPELRVVVMSATLRADRFAQYFRDAGCRAEHVAIQGSLFPVRQLFLEDALAWTSMSAKDISSATDQERERRQQEALSTIAQLGRVERADGGDGCEHTHGLRQQVIRASEQNIGVKYQLILNLIRRIEWSDPAKGGVLVFLPGWKDIAQMQELLRGCREGRDLWVLPLHSQLTSEEQARVFRPAPQGRHPLRKVVLSTTLAETSVTIDDIVWVIDSALMKGKQYDPFGNMESLDNCLVAKANAQQRRGRAGRVQAGFCFTLLPKDKYDALPDFLPPEIARTPLDEVCLQARRLGLGRVEEVLQEALDAPPPESVRHALSQLEALGALEGEEQTLTNLGTVLAMLPVHPVIGKTLLYGAAFRVLDPICVIAAFLSGRSPFVRTPGVARLQGDARAARCGLSESVRSDHIAALRAYEGWVASGRSGGYCRDNLLDPRSMNAADRMAKQFRDLMTHSGFLRRSGGDYSAYKGNVGLIVAALFAGLWPQVAHVGPYVSKKTGKRRGDLCTVLTLDGKTCEIHQGSVNHGVKSREIEQGRTPFAAYFERVRMETTLYLMDTTLFGAVPALLFSTDLEDVGGGVLDVGHKYRRYRMDPGECETVRRLRHLLAFFFQRALDRVDAGGMAEEVVILLAHAVGYPVPLQSVIPGAPVEQRQYRSRQEVLQEVHEMLDRRFGVFELEDSSDDIGPEFVSDSDSEDDTNPTQSPFGPTTPSQTLPTLPSSHAANSPSSVPPEGTEWYFAYGADMSRAHLKDRLAAVGRPDAVRGEVAALLPAHTLAFDWAQPGGFGAALITPSDSEGDEVYGICYGLEKGCAELLRAADSGELREVSVTAMRGGAQISALTVAAPPAAVRPGLLPTQQHLALLTTRADCLPDEYVAMLHDTAAAHEDGSTDSGGSSGSCGDPAEPEGLAESEAAEAAGTEQEAAGTEQEALGADPGGGFPSSPLTPGRAVPS